jgi:uncharacterized alkaline shock family protein YloU
VTDAAATTTRERAGHPAAAEPTPGAKVQQAAVRAAEGVPGVHELGTPGGRALVRAMGRVPGGRTTYGPGVSVEVGERKAAVDVSLVVEFGAPAPAVGGEVREAVREQVRRDTGLEVVEVNVTVVGLHHPDDDLPPEPDPVDPAGAVDVDGAAEGAAPAVDAGAGPGPAGERDAGEEVERIVARAVEEGGADDAVVAGRDADRADSAPEGGPAPTVVVRTADGETPDVVVADQVVLADSVVVVDGDDDQDGPHAQQQEHRQD